MLQQKQTIHRIPAVIWGEPSDRAYLFVHGKASCKEEAERFACIVAAKGCQVISFDLPEHGERTHHDRACNVQNGVEDLQTVMDFVRERWPRIDLFANSLGAYFSLVAYRELRFERCLLASPILDMQRLIENMMRWINVTPRQLEAEQIIETPFGEVLSWDYYSYVKAHPVNVWRSPTAILYPELDALTELAVVEDFARRFDARVQTVPGSEHYLHSAAELAVFDAWVEQYA